jgi:hypothetical protein
MFVDKGLHQRLKSWINGTLPVPDTVPPRARGALAVMNKLQDAWDELYEEALNHNKTLICKDWYNDYWKNHWNFDPVEASVYTAKLFCILLPDLGIPFDNASRNQILSCFDNNPSSYFQLLGDLRRQIIILLEKEHKTLAALRKLDSPQQQVPFEPNSISFLRRNFDYGTSYSPDTRPISRIVDKYFYRPRLTDTDKYRIRQHPVTTEGQILFPLSGRGEPIRCSDSDDGRQVTWGKTKFYLSNEMVDQIVICFFENDRSWYKLGASMTKPTPGGLGEFINNTFDKLTPRHASAIAAIMVQDDLIEFRGHRPIELRKQARE